MEWCRKTIEEPAGKTAPPLPLELLELELLELLELELLELLLEELLLDELLEATPPLELLELALTSPLDEFEAEDAPPPPPPPQDMRKSMKKRTAIVRLRIASSL